VENELNLIVKQYDIIWMEKASDKDLRVGEGNNTKL
jgi:hypothetical protein